VSFEYCRELPNPLIPRSTIRPKAVSRSNIDPVVTGVRKSPEFEGNPADVAVSWKAFIKVLFDLQPRIFLPKFVVDVLSYYVPNISVTDGIDQLLRTLAQAVDALESVVH